MPEYIEREAVLDKQYNANARSDANYKNMVVAVYDIEEIPAADVVAVVRCKDCRWYLNEMCYSYAEEKPNGIEGERCVEPDDFCSYGERRDGE